MRLFISPTDGVPIYMQIVQQVRRLVASGELESGEELPSIRSLADTLVINPNTVARAYRDLEAAGIVTSSRGLGTFVAATDQSTAHGERRSVLKERLNALVVESHQMGIPLAEVQEMLNESYAAFLAAQDLEVPRG